MSVKNSTYRLSGFCHYAKEFFDKFSTTSSYWSSAVLFIALMCGRMPLKVMKISHLTYFYCAYFIN